MERRKPGLLQGIYEKVPGKRKAGRKTMTEIKKCPFCGGEANLHSNYSQKADCYYIFVQCSNCFCKSLSVKSEHPVSKIGQQAVEAWNRREGTA